MAGYSTCVDCKLILTVVDNHVTHPNCTEPIDPNISAYRIALIGDDEPEIARLAAILDASPPVPKLHQAARYYAAVYGWPVFPCRPGAKVPATRNGFKDASRDLDQIDEWWRRWPTANVGLPTGHAFDVIDVDVPDGWRNLWAMQDSNALPDVHAVVSTARGGVHLYVEPTGEGNHAGILPGIDTRAAGGYVIAPPSVVNGRQYIFRHRPSPVITGGVK